MNYQFVPLTYHLSTSIYDDVLVLTVNVNDVQHGKAITIFDYFAKISKNAIPTEIPKPYTYIETLAQYLKD